MGEPIGDRLHFQRTLGMNLRRIPALRPPISGMNSMPSFSDAHFTASGSSVSRAFPKYARECIKQTKSNLAFGAAMICGPG
jgi:hypothetical protein